MKTKSLLESAMTKKEMLCIKGGDNDNKNPRTGPQKPPRP